MTLGESVQIGPFHFYVIRILVAVGILRVFIKREHLEGGLNKLDWLMIAWGMCAVFSSFFHEDFTSALVSRLGMVYDGLGVYFLLRVLIQGPDGVLQFSRLVLIVLIPIAIEMAFESVTGKNNFSILGGVGAETEVRLGKYRAQGPFLHSILAGTVGAVCWPLVVPFWWKQRGLAILGLVRVRNDCPIK